MYELNINILNKCHCLYFIFKLDTYVHSLGLSSLKYKLQYAMVLMKIVNTEVHALHTIIYEYVSIKYNTSWYHKECKSVIYVAILHK